MIESKLDLNGSNVDMEPVPTQNKKRKKKAKKRPKYDPSKNPVQVLNESFQELEYDFNKTGMDFFRAYIPLFRLYYCNQYSGNGSCNINTNNWEIFKSALVYL